MEAASCPLEVAADLQVNQKSNIFFHHQVLVPQFILLSSQQVCFVADLNFVIIYKFANVPWTYKELVQQFTFQGCSSL